MAIYKATIKMLSTYIEFVDSDNEEEAEMSIVGGKGYDRQFIGSEEWVAEVELADDEPYIIYVTVVPGWGYRLVLEDSLGNILDDYKAGDHPKDSSIFGSGLTPAETLKEWAMQTSRDMASYHRITCRVEYEERSRDDD